MSKTRNNMRSSEEHSSLSSCTSSSSDEEEIDTRDLKPIKNYLSNRKELARQLFKSVKPEKIRMMLPQVLKHVDLSELEEYCVNELNGMSKARILSKLNGKPMLESSDTSESDDSGPSLEIISDTEEWLTDDDTSKTENGKQGKLKRDKVNIKRKAQIKKNDSDKSKAKCIKNENSDKTNKNVKIKKEDDKDKGKEGDSLLDLLELEMRARAIRALIRKEEDVIPSTNPSEINDSQTIENNIATRHDDDKAKENCRKQLEQIISAQQSKGEDEDVVLVIQPTPVVELLSSDSDGEVDDETRISKKLKNERAMETGKSANNLDENAKNSNKIVGTQATGKHNNTNIVTKADLNSEIRTIMPDRNVDIKNNTLSISISADNVAERRKRSKKKSHTKLQLTSSTNENTSKSKQINITEQSNDVNDVNTTEQLILSDEDKIMEEKNKTEEEISKESKIEEERLADLDEVIDLDDYCDVMDIENCDEDKSQDEIIVPSQEEHKESVSQTLPKSDSMETWASRYYQTDDVQNVIKESKIQSEIRKRLRERQRLSKLNKSPNLNLSSQSSSTDTAVTSEKIPTGSVEEYLALKRTMNTNVTTNSNNNTTTQDNTSQSINSNSDINVKEMSMQDENSSSHQENKDRDAQKINTSEMIESTELAKAVVDISTESTELIKAVAETSTESTELIKAVADTKHDTQPG
ncbi:Uncharacterized protein C9orf82-like protein [Camponotus floridanus]|uniref:Uncharacterized protein C9orf82-like protein n=1 Tax=Camponotus floridanus TaxID=104421 RepID=E1ZY30_CAMFO|nr:Uncharacterized protein C9orf82-like protein [Camponotus floridanus]